MKKSKGLTLTEILVSSILFASVVAGFLSVIVSTRRLNARSIQRIQAINVAQQVLEDFYDDVREWDWNTASNDLQTGNYTNYTNRTVNNVDYTVDYNVDDSSSVLGSGRVKIVDITVRWTLD